MAKRKATPKQLANLAKGRDKLFQNQMRAKGINPNPRPQIIERVVRQPINNYHTTHQHNLKVNVSLFDKLIGTKFFPIEINKQKEVLNIKELLRHILNRLDFHWKNISLNKTNVENIINHINYTDKVNENKFEELERRINVLEDENAKLKNKDKNEN
jgi:hypothetical protein